MILVDVHAHLDIAPIYHDADYSVENIILSSNEHNVKIIVANGVDVESNRKVLEISKKYPIVKAALGIYPTHCVEIDKAKFDKEIEFIEFQIKNKNCIAIGEVGLDYKEIKDMTQEQKDLMKERLTMFIQLAKKHNIPIILHSRNAELELIELLENTGMKNHKVIMHCFSGRKHLVKRIKENKWHITIPCNVDRSEHFQNIAKEIPIEQLLTETDTPYLSPFPNRNNRPDNIRFTIKKISELKEMNPEEVANIIFNNYQKLFL